MCGGKTTVKAPEVTPEERALQAQQAELLKQQTAVLERQQQDAEYQRGLYGQMMAQEQQRQAQAQQQWAQYWQSPEGMQQRKYQQRQMEIANQEADRYQKALSGQLPISEGTKQREDEERRQLEASLSSRLGSNWENSTSGIQSLESFDKRWGALKDAERYGQLQLGAQTALARAGLSEQSEGADWQRYLQGQGFESDLFGNTFNQSGIANQFGYGQGLAGYGGVQSGYGQAQQPYQQQRSMQQQANISNAQNSGGMSGLFGNVLGLAAGSVLGPWGMAAGSALGGSMFGGGGAAPYSQPMATFNPW